MLCYYEVSTYLEFVDINTTTLEMRPQVKTSIIDAMDTNSNDNGGTNNATIEEKEEVRNLCNNRVKTQQLERFRLFNYIKLLILSEY